MNTPGIGGLSGMDQCRLCLPQRRKEPAGGGQLERAILPDSGDGKSDLIQMGDEHHGRLSLADVEPEVSRGVGFRFCPPGQHPLNGGTDRRFHP